MRAGALTTAILLTALCVPHAEHAFAADVASEAEAARDRLAGRWLLDPEASDGGMRRLDRELRRVSRGLRPQRAPRPGFEPRPGSERRLERELLRPVRLPERSVGVRLDAGAVTLRIDDGELETLPTDGRSPPIDADNPYVRIAAWERADLWIERASDHGTRVIETWRTDATGLAIDYEVRNALFEDPVEFTLRFLRAPAGAIAGPDPGAAP